MTRGAPGSRAATLIMRNEARCIVRCLESVRPWVDRMVVLDTGSSDNSVDLARGCGAQVHHLPWPDDFSIARNHALALADADWNLIIDADEWLDSGGALLAPWCAGPARVGILCVNSIGDPSAIGSALPVIANWMPRLLPRGARFEGRIHEQVISPFPSARIALHLSHDGYMEAQQAPKRARNRPLLLRALKEHPGDVNILYQLGKDVDLHKDYAAACQWYSRALDAAPRRAPWTHELLVRLLYCLAQTGRSDEALALVEQHIGDWSDSPDFFFVLGHVALGKARTNPAHALDQWFPLALSAWTRCLEIGDRPDLEGSIQGHGSHLARDNLEMLKGRLATIAA